MDRKKKFPWSEAFTTVTIKNAVFWDASPKVPYTNRRFGGTYRLHRQGDKNQLSASIATYRYRCSYLADSLTLIMEGMRSSETSVFTRATRRHIPEDGVLQGVPLPVWPVICSGITSSETLSASSSMWPLSVRDYVT
jgi:hypothetical protein